MNRKNTRLYERMTQDMQLKGFSPRTQESYLLALRRLDKHYNHKPLNKITEEEIRQYFLHRLNVDKWAKATCKTALLSKGKKNSFHLFRKYRKKRHGGDLTHGTYACSQEESLAIAKTSRESDG